MPILGFVPVQIDGEPSVVWKLGAFQAWEFQRSVQNRCEFLHVSPNLDDWQAFVDAETSENFGYSVYSVDDVHRVGILDLRIDT